MALLLASLSMLLAFLAGKDLNWDLFNYHYYNGWAVLHQRWRFDLAPAQLQSYYNPLLDVPLYLGISYLPPWLLATCYAAVQGLNGWLVWRIAQRLLPPLPQREWAALAIAVISLTGAIYRSEVGGGMGDTLFSLPLLVALWLLISRGERLAAMPWLRATGWLALAGVLAGIATGLKLVALIYALGFGLASAALGSRPSQRLAFPCCFGIGAILGLMCSGGPWMWHLWRDFANPLYPLFNNVFASPFAPIAALRDDRFLPQNVWQALFYPLYWLAHPRAVSDAGRFLDLRLPLLFVAALCWVVALLRQRTRAMQRASAFLLLGMLGAYALWLALFGIYRYLSVLELLAPLALAVLLFEIGLDRRAIVTLLLLCAIAVMPLRWGRGPWTVSYFEVQVPPRVTAVDRGVVLLGVNTPSAFLLPLLPQSLRYIRIASNFHGQRPEHGLDREARRIIADDPGPRYALFNAADTEAMDARLGSYTLQRDRTSCVAITTAAATTRPVPQLPQPFLWCALKPLAGN